MTLDHVIWFLVALATLALLGAGISILKGSPPRQQAWWMLAFFGTAVTGGLLRGVDLFIV